MCVARVLRVLRVGCVCVARVLCVCDIYDVLVKRGSWFLHVARVWGSHNVHSLSSWGKKNEERVHFSLSTGMRNSEDFATQISLPLFAWYKSTLFLFLRPLNFKSKHKSNK